MTVYFCDACGEKTERPMVTEYKRGALDKKVYDLCNKCDAAIQDILHGRQVGSTIVKTP
jgi:hypothetical protein